MPKEYRQSLVNGYFDGDGYCVKDEVWKSTTVSKKLAHGIRLLCETLGYSCSVYYYDVPSTTVIEGRTVSQKSQYQIRVSKTKRTNSIKQNGFNWYKCTSVEPYCENQTVYNITVNKDHSYIVEGFVVHNCQDLSIAGKRDGLAGERSGLFMEAVRIIKEMRNQSGGLYPAFAVWENVPGTFSSNKGEDFRTVLEELARIKQTDISIPRPKNGKWAKAGFICGNDWSIAWRTFDAQFWGVPQRRRRIAVVVDLGGQRAGEILFERTGVSGNPEPSIPPWKGIARNPAHSPAGHDRMVEGAGFTNRGFYSGIVSETLRAESHGAIPMVAEPTTYPGVGITSKQNASNPQPGNPCHTLNTDSRNYVCVPINDKATRWMGGGKSRNHDGSGNGLGVGDETDPMFTLTAGDRHAVCCIGVDGYNGCETGDKSITIRARKSDQDHVGRVAIPINTQIATRHISLGERTGMGWGEDGDPVYTLQAGHEHAVCCLLNDQGGQRIQVEDGLVSPTLRAESHGHGPVVMCRSHGQANAETLEDLCPTLNCNHEQPIVFESHSQDARYAQQGDTSPACTAQWGTGGNNMPLVLENHGFQNTGVGWWNQSEVGATLRTPCGGDSTKANVIAELKSTFRWIVRRLTTTECERLQGYPDGWTDIGDWVDSKGKRHKTADSPRYKALGNSIALPQWWWITCKMAKYLPEHATLGSLFDGIGGFPLVWETLHGKGTTIWASEIEEFPIAVTKKHFGDGKDG